MYADDYPEVEENAARVVAVLVKEEKAFRRTLRKGIKQLTHLREGRRSAAPNCSRSTTPSGSRSSCRTEEARTKGIALTENWRAEFDEKMAEQRHRSQSAAR